MMICWDRILEDFVTDRTPEKLRTDSETFGYISVSFTSPSKVEGGAIVSP
jgi:hypothetical protein